MQSSILEVVAEPLREDRKSLGRVIHHVVLHQEVSRYEHANGAYAEERAPGHSDLLDRSDAEWSRDVIRIFCVC